MGRDHPGPSDWILKVPAIRVRPLGGRGRGEGVEDGGLGDGGGALRSGSVVVVVRCSSALALP